MQSFSTHLLFFLAPGLVCNILHMVVVKRNLWSFVAIPVAERALGRNKTWRGFLFLPLSMAVFSGVLSRWLGPVNQSVCYDTLIGGGLGLSYMLAELPNSFVKRRLGIATGQSSGSYRIVQLVVDKSDSLLGTCLFYYWASGVPFRFVALFFLIGFALHVSISTLLYRIKLKKSI